MNTRCKPGDMAIVIDAQNPDNIGLIVTVMGLHDPEAANFRHDLGPVWTCECAHPMIWTRDGRPHMAHSGPIPDRLLQPIRGLDTPAKSQVQDEGIAALTTA